MSASTVRLVDIEDDELIDKLAMRVTEKNIKERQNKRKRRASSTDEDVMEEDDDEVTLAMLLEAKKELREVIDRLSKKYDGLEGKIDGNKKKCDALEKKDATQCREISNLQQELSILRRECHDSFTQIKKDVSDSKKEAADARREASALSAETQKLKAQRRQNARRMVDLEARSRRNNLIFYGIQEKEKSGEEEENCITTVKNFLKDSLNIDIHCSAMQRAHRLGKPRNKNNIGRLAFTPRPIIVLFTDFQQKEIIRKKRFDLARPFGISEDLPIEIRKARKSIENLVKDLKAQGKKVAILYPCRLLIDGKIDESTKVDIANFVDEE